MVVSFLQRPGATTFDTKLDLAVNPLGFLRRALSLWNPGSAAGELQNQAYGYLFPMGPFFAVGQLAGVPPWIVQRLWCALLLCAAFTGALLLARALGVGSEPTRLAAALAYALAPRVLTEIGPLSAEMLPAVMLPWVVLPLVTADRVGSPRRAAGLSALAVLCTGGTNGAMVVMALVLPCLWLLTRVWNARHRALVLWWCGSVLAVCLWWILPLLLLGRYSLPFLDYVESAVNTTAPLSLFEVLRGTDQWVAYVVRGTPWWPAGWLLIDDPLLMTGTAAVAAAGLVGLCRAELPERRFLVLGAVVGLTLLTVGHVGSLDGPFAEPVRALLDGPLAPLRNVHKFEPVLRLCVVLGFAHGLDLRAPRGLRAVPPVWRRRLRLGTAALLVLVVSAPAWLLTLRPGTGWSEVPQHWRQAMSWLGQQDPHARTLLLPATGFGQYTWGRTVDEPAQALAEAPWAVRNQVPLGSEGNTRLMDAVHEALADGRGSPGLADLLARSGHRFLLLRNDVDRTAVEAPPLAVLRGGLAASPGVERVAEFGPVVAMADQRLTSPVDREVTGHALEVYEVRRPVPLVTAVATSAVPIVSGGPESLLPLLSQGLLRREQPSVLAGERDDAADGGWLVTDGLRRRERNVGRVADNLGQTMTAREDSRQDRPALDVSPFPDVRHQTVAEYRGVRAVRASTSSGYADAAGAIDPATAPFAAVDGDAGSAWHSSSFTGPVGQWLEVELDTPRELTGVTVRMVDDLRVGWPVTRVRITTATGSSDHDVPAGGGPATFPIAPGLTGTVRVTVLEMSAGRRDGNAGIAELSLPGTAAQRALRVPHDAPGTTPAFSFTRGGQFRPACHRAQDDVRCDAALSRFGEEHSGVARLFRTDAPATFRVAASVVAAAGAGNPVRLPGLEVSASSALAGDVAAGALSAVDGDPATAWLPDVTDLRPVLSLSWAGERSLTELRLAAPPSGRRPVELELRAPGREVVVRTGSDGVARFEPIATDRLDVAVLESSGGDAGAPGGIGELTLPALADRATPLPPETPFTVPCGSGPEIEVDGQRITTSVSGTLADVTAHRVLPATSCDDDLAQALELGEGDHFLSTTRSASFVVQDVWLRPASWAEPRIVQRETRVLRWDATSREVAVAGGPRALLVVPENANDGWRATLDGTELARTRVDGWQQAWVLPEGAGGAVRLEFAPDAQYRAGLLAGGASALGLLAVVALPVRRPSGPGVRPTTSRWVQVALVVLLGVLGGMAPVVALIATLLLRQFFPTAPRLVVLGATVAACAVAVTGRLLGHGQEWAYGPWAQGALLIAVSAVVSSCFGPFAGEER